MSEDELVDSRASWARVRAGPVVCCRCLWVSRWLDSVARTIGRVFSIFLSFLSLFFGLLFYYSIIPHFYHFSTLPLIYILYSCV